MLLGVSVGVIVILFFQSGLSQFCLLFFLASSTFKTCKNVVFHWKLESEEVKRNGCGIWKMGWLKMRLALKEVERWRVSNNLFWV